MSRPKTLNAVVLAAWAGLFWLLLVTGDWTLYLAARVGWLVPVAALAFTVGAAGQLIAARSGRGGAVTSRHAWNAALMLAPVIVVLVIPLGTLSSFAAERRTSFSAARFSSEELEPGKALTFQQLAGAAASADGRRALAGRAGEPVKLVGLALGIRDGGFELTRFVVSCCVIDATVVAVPVRSPARVSEGGWVEVAGELRIGAGGKPELHDATLRPTSQPNPPYLYPG